MAQQAPPTVCRFGRKCHRPGCYYAHPEGRDIDSQGAVGAPRGAPEGGPHAGPATAFSLLNPNLNGNPASVTRTLPPSKVPCKFDRKCSRKECYFYHPNGRELDDGFEVASDEHEDEIDEIERAIEQEDEAKMDHVTSDNTDTWFPGSQSCTCCQGYRFRCDCKDQEDGCKKCTLKAQPSPLSSAPKSKTSKWAPWMDEWFPASKDCDCCHGYKLRCEAPACQEKGTCNVCAGK